MMGRTVREAVFEMLLALPGVEEVRTHGTPTFKVGGKTFAYWTVNHHGDGRAAVWVGSPPDVQQQMVALTPNAYFVPPYVGVKGWLGVDLNQGLPWEEIKARVYEAWAHRATADVRAEFAADAWDAAPPDTPMAPEDINPMLGARPQEILRGLAERCRQLPETQPEDASTSATWKAGKKVFVRGHVDEGRMKLLFRVGPEQQAMMLEDDRFALPMYYHSSGWIELDVQDHIHWPEIEGLLETSFRHFALKRMITALDASPPW